jgi:arabinoxylan arabinofuranohydrolase
MLVADRPEGPYKDLLGKAIIDRNTPNCGSAGMEWLFDPGLFVDSTASGTQAYVVFGGGAPYGSNFRIVKVNDDMKSISGTPLTLEAKNSFEGPFIHKYNNKYYLSYPTSGASNIDYLMSDDPMTGWVHKGTVLPNPTLDGKNINTNNNSHESIIEYKGQWYMFYHDRRISNATYKRNASVDILKYNTDGTMQKVIVTSAGPAQIKKLNPYDTIQAETIWKQNGIETEFCNEGGVMVTNIAAGDYTSLKGVDFGTGAKTFEVRAASASSGGTVEVHLESATGTVVATCSVTGTGGATTWKTFSCDVTDCSGVKNVYFVYKGTGEPFRLNWFRFTSKDVGINKSVNQIQQAQETRNLFAYPLIGTNKLPDGSIYDLSGKMVRSPLKNSSLLNKPAMGIFIIKKK